MKEEFSFPAKIYLDTSIFVDFLRKYLRDSLKNPKKLELVTNPEGNSVLALKHEFKLPKIPPRIDFIMPKSADGYGYTVQYPSTSTVGILNTVSSKNRQYFISHLIESETIRNLRTDFSLKEEETLELIKFFKIILSLKYVDRETIENNQELVELSLRYPIKKNVQDLQNILISKQNDCWLLLNDKLSDNLEKIKEESYSKILSFREFVELVRKCDKNIDKIVEQAECLKSDTH